MNEEEYLERKQSFRPILSFLLSQGMKEELSRQEIIEYIGQRYKPDFAQKVLDLWFGMDPNNKESIYYKEDTAYKVACEEISELIMENRKLLRDENDSKFRYKERFSKAKLFSVVFKSIKKVRQLVIVLLGQVYKGIKFFVAQVSKKTNTFIVAFVAMFKKVFKMMIWVGSIILLISLVLYLKNHAFSSSKHQSGIASTSYQKKQQPTRSSKHSTDKKSSSGKNTGIGPAGGNGHKVFKLNKYYVINRQTVNVRSKPNSNSPIITKLHKHKKVKVTKRSLGWFYIDNLGWVYGKLLKPYSRSKKSKVGKQIDRSVWHCDAKAKRASGWVEKVGKQNAIQGALKQCEIRRQTLTPCRIVNCYKL